MRRTLVAGLVFAAACSGPATVAPTSAPTTRGTLPPLTTTVPTQPVEITDCSTPPVTFSPLCEVFELLDTWYVDAPVDVETLAGVALRGLNDFTTTERDDPPRVLLCAIPDPAFSDLCHRMAERVLQTGIPVGPAVEAAIAYMVDVGLDPFTWYFPPDQVGAVRLSGVVGGVGLLLDARDAVGSKCKEINDICRLEIVGVLEDNPGFTSGLTEGDIITAVDEQAVEGKGFAAIVAEIAGDETGTVTISVDRGGEPLTFSIERAELTIPTVEVALPARDVGYLRIPDFEFDIPGLVRDALDDLAPNDPSTLVVDLRDNPGGFIDSVVAVADQFIDSGTVLISEAPDEFLEYEARPGGRATSPRLLVLVNKGTASAAEILAGALRDRRGAVVIGSDTFGKDAVQIPFTLRNGGEFYVAIARWSTPNGDSVGDGGLAPDIELAWPAGATVEEVVQLAMEAAS